MLNDYIVKDFLKAAQNKWNPLHIESRANNQQQARVLEKDIWWPNVSTAKMWSILHSENIHSSYSVQEYKVDPVCKIISGDVF